MRNLNKRADFSAKLISELIREYGLDEYKFAINTPETRVLSKDPKKIFLFAGYYFLSTFDYINRRLLNLGGKNWVSGAPMSRKEGCIQCIMQLQPLFMISFAFTRILPSMEDSSAKMRLNLEISELEGFLG